MISNGIPIGRIFGISIRVHISWFIIFCLMAWTLVASFPIEWGYAVRVVTALITSLLFFASVLLHELMHGIVAMRNKIPVGAVTLFVFGGMAQIVEEPCEPGVEFRVAIVGPMTSIALGLVLFAIYLLLPIWNGVVLVVLSWLGLINLMLGVFNIIPAFPMDGGRVLRSFIWWRTRNLRRSTMIASTVSKIIAALFIIGGICLFVFTSYGFNGLWFAFVGWFLYGAASDGYQQLVLQQALQGYTAREVVTRDYARVRPDMSVEELVSGGGLSGAKCCFIVAADACLYGMVTMREIRKVPGSKRGTRTVEQIMKPMGKLKTVGLDDDLIMVVRVLADQNIDHVPVIEHGRMVGTIGRDSLLGFINLKGTIGS